MRKLIKLTLEFILAIYGMNVFGWWQGLALAFLSDCIGDLVGDLLIQTAVLLVYRKRIPKEAWFKRFFHMCAFPLFDVIGKWASYIAVFKRVEWKEIPHDRIMDVAKLN